jgi:hypothetical protein
MTSDRWEHIFALFDAALARPEAGRSAFLAGECGENAQLRQEIESLLAAHGDAQGLAQAVRLARRTYTNRSADFHSFRDNCLSSKARRIS